MQKDSRPPVHKEYFRITPLFLVDNFGVKIWPFRFYRRGVVERLEAWVEEVGKEPIPWRHWEIGPISVVLEVWSELWYELKTALALLIFVVALFGAVCAISVATVWGLRSYPAGTLAVWVFILGSC